MSKEQNITAVIVEDEFKVRTVFKDLLLKFCPEITLIGEADNINEGCDLIMKLKPKLVFLDIEMPGGNGFELLSKFEEPFFETIFVTSYGHHAIRAIKYSALDYMLKPVMIEDVKMIADRYRSREEMRHFAEQYRLLKDNLSGQHQRLVINNKTRMDYVDVDNISYLKADGNYTAIHLIGGAKHHVSKTLKEYEEILCEHGINQFIRIHKTYIVNITCIDHLEKGEEAFLKLKDGTRLEVSRRKKNELLSRLYNL